MELEQVEHPVMQATQLPSAVKYLPGLHTHRRDLVSRMKPVLQAVQLVEVTLQDVQLALHAVHINTLFTACKYVPSLQGVHTPLVRVDPTAHTVHTDAVQV